MFVGQRAKQVVRPFLFRSYATVTGEALVFREHGAPLKVLEYENHYSVSNSENEVLVKMLAAPINPSDINVLQGTYGILPTFPAIGGNEGVGTVVDPGNSKLQVGDWVIPATSGTGTWRSHRVCDVTDLIKVRNDIPVEYAATIASNPSTAFRLLSDFVTLKKGDTIIQNAANSMVGVCVNQIAKHKGINVINVVRERPADQQQQLVKKLNSVGAEIIITEEQLASSTGIGKLPKPVLAINSVGGKSATNIARTLADGGTVVTIGGMSRQPVLLPTGALIFKDLSFKGFWMTRWHENHSISERAEMFDAITAMVKDGKLKLWFESFPLSEYTKAIEKATSEHKDTKVIFKF